MNLNNMDIESTILGLSYLGIFILMIFNGIFSFPSSQILYIIVGYFIGIGNLSFEYALIAGVIGNTVGNIALYEITREHGAGAALKYIPSADRHLAKAERYFAKRGILFLFAAKLLPALKVLVPIIAGISKTNRAAYISIIVTTSILWAYALISLGLFFGKNMSVYESYLPALGLIAVLVTVFFIYSYTRPEKNIK